MIQNTTPVGLKKNEVTCSGEMPGDDDPALVVEIMKKECHEYIFNPNNPRGCVEVVQEGVSYPQPNEKETQEAVQELMNELNIMVDQATQTYSPLPPPEDDNEGFKRMVRMATIFQSLAFQNPRPCARPVDYMVCPCHDVRLEERKSQKGWEYVKCPMHLCLLFCAKEKTLDYMREVYRQPHPDVCDMWSCLLCFCRKPATFQQSQSQDNPNRLFRSCSKKKCKFFWWADQPSGQKYSKWFHENPPKKSEHPLPTRGADGYPKRGYDIPGPPPRVRRQEDVQRERPLTDYENLCRCCEKSRNSSRQEVLVAPAPPPPKYSDSWQNWQKGLETVAYDYRTGLPSDGLF